MAASIEVEPLTTTIAARLHGADLRNLGRDEAQLVRDALDTYGVLVFSDQHLDLAEQCRFAETFGPLEPLPSVKFLGMDHVLTLDGLVKPTNERPAGLLFPDHQGWHTDSSFTAQIPRAAVLRAEVIPPVGGATSWTHMSAAYEALSDEMQRWLSGLRATHWYPPGYREAIGLHRQPEEVQRSFDEAFPPREHPIVVQHPRSGRRLLFVNPTYTTGVVGLSPKEGRFLLSFLFTHLAASDFVYRHRWREGDIVVWDELATLHLAPDDFAPHRRRVVRVTAGLETPTAAEPACA
jgi:taurine dioxygenase